MVPDTWPASVMTSTLQSAATTAFLRGKAYLRGVWPQRSSETTAPESTAAWKTGVEDAG